MADAPSGYRTQEVMSAWQRARNQLLTDEDIATDEALLSEMLGAETAEVDDILHRLLRASVHAADMAGAAEARAVEIEARRGRYRKRAETLRTAAYQVMEAIGRKREELPDMTVTLRAGSPSVFIIDEELIPPVYIREKVERSYDKKAMLPVLIARRDAEELAMQTDGDVTDLPPPIPGATLSNGPSTLQIRRK